MTFINVDTKISTHAAIKQNVHGVGANDIADVADISTHAAVKQNVHGVGANDIADVADISTHAAVTTNVHGTGAGNVIVGSDELSEYKIKKIGTYTGNNNINRAIPHNLGSKPFLVRITRDGGFYIILLFGNADTELFSIRDNSTPASYTVTAMNATNFYVGVSGAMVQTMNATGENYTYEVFE